MSTSDPFMTDGDDAVDAVEIDEAAAAGSDAVAADSPLERLRRTYAARRRQAELFLPVPGWGDALVARVTVPDHDFTRRITGTPGTVDWMADFVAETVDGLFEIDGVDDDGSPRLTAIESESGPLRFNVHYADTVGLPEALSAREAVQSAFTIGGEDSLPVINVVALAEFANTIERWLGDTSRDIAEAIVPGR
ncbi:hypothetical protein Q5424_09390 [Conexibacter sp. JD483]|uniref:hypothetical protein n=1 Tax=unclassified Conexibacter TaxID=2627773 RepID=UPI002728E7F5|nr:MULTISPECIES: hypothetical protein [unclassified Conexibacter]MDO8187210.1 hypothetical protein [Conexibacter sp. CPCC 205706]MDO8199307.1 hypothetical protein [Conexibacter sp. CPCC 205762]MDR9369292.1 hypothetical protein [Conexibacter sp. JD483]